MTTTDSTTRDQQCPTTAPLTSPGRLVPDEALTPAPDSRFGGLVQSRQGELDWLNAALRGVDLSRGDQILIEQPVRDANANVGADQPGAHWAIVIERARAAERAATVAELGAAGATEQLLEAARAEGHATGRAEAEQEHAAAEQSRQHAERAERERVRDAWSTVLGALGTEAPAGQH